MTTTEGTAPEMNGTTVAGGVEELLSHAKAGVATINGLLETATSASTGITDAQKLTATALTDAQTKLTEITTVTTLALAAKTKIEADQAVIATKSDHIQSAQAHADKVRADLDRTLTGATQQTTEIEGHKSRAQTAADTATTLMTEIRTN
jgi:hypothetical protein